MVLPAGCAHTYYYLAETQNADGIQNSDQGGIVYLVPPTGSTEFSLQVQSLGIRKAHNAQMLGLRIYFVRGSQAIQHEKGIEEYFDPKDLFVKLENGKAIKPAYIRSKFRNQSKIVLTGVQYEVIELLFPLPPTVINADNVAIFFFHWKIHYGIGKTDENIASFDRSQTQPKPSNQTKDKNYPYCTEPFSSSGWFIGDDPYWWSYDPWWPWEFQ